MDTLLRNSTPLPDTGRRPPFDEKHGRYRARFARTEAEVDQALKLRFEVFNLELGEGLASSVAARRDHDAFDAQCEHLLVFDEKAGRVIGTYRLQTKEAADDGAGFYSASEFDLDALPVSLRARSVELGRACIDRDHRSRKVLLFLWRGLAHYAHWNRKTAMFGCSSLTSRDPADGLAALCQLESAGQLHAEYSVPPLPAFACADTDSMVRPSRTVKIPRLFATYLRYGARVLGPPARDAEFGTIDFLTLVELDLMDPRTLANFVPTGAPRC